MLSSPRSVLVLLLPGALLAGPWACCRINRLAELGPALERVSVEGRSLHTATLELDRRADEGAVAAPGGEVRNPQRVAEHRRVIAPLGDERLGEALAGALAEALGRELGWGLAAPGGARLLAEVEELCVRARDSSSSVEVLWQLRAELRDARGEVAWRDCLEGVQPLPGTSLERLAVTDEAARFQLQTDIAREMAAAVAARLQADRRPRPGPEPRAGREEGAP